MSSPSLKQPARRQHEFDDDEASKKRRRSSFGVALLSLHDIRAGKDVSPTKRSRRSSLDRFIAAPTENRCPLDATPRSRKLAKVFGFVTDRNIRYASPPPPIEQNALQSIQKRLTRALYSAPTPLSLTSAATNISRASLLTLSAPGIADDFYARPAAWSAHCNLLAVASHRSVNCRNMHTAEISTVCPILEHADHFAQLEWVPHAPQLAMGVSQGEIRVMDVARRVPAVDFIPERYTDEVVGALGWRDANELVAGYTSGRLRRYDKRVNAFPTSVLRAHRGRVCTVRWNAAATLFATGSGDGVVLCWDTRNERSPLAEVDHLAAAASSSNLASSSNPSSSSAEANPPARKWRARKHRSTVKALAWCPWQPDVLATGGGTQDGAIRFWSAATGAPRRRAIHTDSQVSSLHWSLSCKEIASTHGYAFRSPRSEGAGGAAAPRRHSILVHSYPRGERVGSIFDPGHGRISDACLSPDGRQLLTCGADETIRLYDVFGAVSAPVGEESELSRCLIR